MMETTNCDTCGARAAWEEINSHEVDGNSIFPCLKCRKIVCCKCRGNEMEYCADCAP